jgi:DNA-binding CsgD family transcriptional regulator
MKTKGNVLTKEERAILILAAPHPSSKHLSKADIAQRLGISVSRVKTLIHQACVKLGAHNRNEAIFFALTRGEISLSEVYSLNELAELFSSFSPDMLRRIARQGLGHGYLTGKDERIIYTDRRQDTILTKSERDVLILASRGLTNKEIADRLYISSGSVRIFLNRACMKLGARKRSGAVFLALKQREITIDELASLNEVVQALVLLGAESLEKIAQLLNQKPGREPILTGS